MVIHVVKSGETIYSIAATYGVLPGRIMQDNQIIEPQRLAIGQTLVILFPALVHTVRRGETLHQLALTYGVTENHLYRNNPALGGEPLLYPGQSLVIFYEGKKQGSLSVNGYAYDFIDRGLLRQTLPYLSSITFFTYGFTPEGALIGIADDDLVPLAKSYGVAPLMGLSTLTAEGVFSNELAHMIFLNPVLQKTLIQNILKNLKVKGYAGVDVDFEYILGEDKDLYTAFIKNLKEVLDAYGYFVSVALAPKTYDEQPGLLYEAHDYPALGIVADAIVLMTYEWGYAYGPPMAVSPLNNMKTVVDYAVSRVAPDKIYLGVPNYGYDWQLPYQAGNRAPSLGNQEALMLGQQQGATIEFDPMSQAPYFYYDDRHGVTHVVWFEDARSIEAKLALAFANGLLGVSYWNLMRPFPQNWLVLNSIYEILHFLPEG